DKIRSQSKPFLYLFQLVAAKDPVHVAILCSTGLSPWWRLVQDVAVEGTSSTDSYGGPWSPYFFAPRRRFCAIFSPTCTCLDFAQQSIRFLLIQPPGI
ncbi:hypothetical protein, partial [Aeromonas sp. QDB18]|uniref:hypothetical protein n=1 Tax=Aeromonas sp. QDB18 TaxID=2990486 RepID=UPI0022E4B1C4